jgi:hypothetical protein
MSLFNKIKKLIFRNSSTSIPIIKPANVHEEEFLDETSSNHDSLLKMEISEQVRIAGLWKDQWREYLIEEHSFRQKYMKSCKCDVCGKYEEELFFYHNQTYCVSDLPVERSYVERKVKAGRHGSSKDYLKKVP